MFFPITNELQPTILPPEPADLPPDTASIREMGALPLPEVRSNIYCMSIVGQIEGHMILPAQNKTTKYEHIMPQLIAIEESPDIEGFIMLMNTVGGDVEAGLAIAEMISTMSKPSVSLVLGGGHSIGVPLAVSTNYSFIVSSATMTIHPIRMTGLIISVPQTYDYFNKMQDRVVNFITSHCRVERDTFLQMMMSTGELANDIGTVLVGKEAAECGIIDAVGGLRDALSKLRELINERIDS